MLWRAENLSQPGNDRIITKATTTLLLEVQEGVQLELKGAALLCFCGSAAQLEFDLGEQ